MLNRYTVLLTSAIGLLIWTGIQTAFWMPSSVNTPPAETYSLHNTVSMTALLPDMEQTSRPSSLGSNGELIYTRFNNMSFGIHQTPEESSLAELGLKDNSYVEFNSEFNLSRHQEIHFIVFSTEDFNILLDGKEYFSMTIENDYTENRFAVALNPGRHSLQLQWFRTSGTLGLDMYYTTPDSDSLYFVGESSELVKFKEMR